MPLYEYQCKKCHSLTEKIQKFSDPPLTVCPHCGGELEQLISAPAIQFKGSGWYVNDYAKSSSKGGSSGGNGASSSSDSSSESKSENKSEGKSESKSESKSEGSKSSSGSGSGESSSSGLAKTAEKK